MNRKLRWGIMGCAGIAVNSVMPAIRDSKTGVLTAIASRGLDKAKKTAEAFGISRVYSSYEELLADPGVDAVYIPLPNHLHREWVIRAAAAGKHVLCEKPLALDAREAAEMVEACTKAGVHLAEAFMYRHHPRILQLKELIDGGAIGEVRVIRGAFTYNAAADTGNIRFVSAWGGGSLYDIGCYPLSAARLLFGEEPEAVTAHALFSPEHDNVDMMASGMVEFSGGKSLIFECGMWAFGRQVLDIIGTEGRIEVPRPFNGSDDAAFTVHTKDGIREVDAEGANPYTRQADDFAEAVFGGKPRYVPADAVLNMMLIEACLHSARTRERVNLSRP